MLSAIKKVFLFLNLVLNHGISPYTILSNSKPLNNPGFIQFDQDQNKHCM